VLPVPDFHPQIAKFKLAGGVASLEQIIMLSGFRAGGLANGLRGLDARHVQRRTCSDRK
jgi:hypothetical protein